MEYSLQLQQIYPAPALVVYTFPASQSYAAPAPVVEYISPAVYAAPAPVVEFFTHAPAESYAAPTPIHYVAPVSCRAPTMTVTGVDLNRDGIPDVLQQPWVGFGASVHYGAPVHTWRGCLLYWGDVVSKDVNAVVRSLNACWVLCCAIAFRLCCFCACRGVQLSSSCSYAHQGHQVRDNQRARQACGDLCRDLQCAYHCMRNSYPLRDKKHKYDFSYPFPSGLPSS